MDGWHHIAEDAAAGTELQWGHGREAMDGEEYRNALITTANFNGAMAVRPWMGMRGIARPLLAAQLQWGHGREAMDGRSKRTKRRATADFNGAMAVRPWMEATQNARPSSISNFNGAMAVRPWMARGAYRQGRRRGRTSMGPWP